MQAAAGGEIEAARLAEHGAGSAGTQAFLHGPQHIVAVARPGNDQTVRAETEGAEAGAEQVAPRKAPQRRAPAVDKAGEQRRGKTLRRAGTAGDDLVQRTTGQTAPGQHVIDRRQIQGYGLDGSPAGAELKGTDAGAKRVESNICGVPWHGPVRFPFITMNVCSYFVLFQHKPKVNPGKPEKIR